MNYTFLNSYRHPQSGRKLSGHDFQGIRSFHLTVDNYTPVAYKHTSPHDHCRDFCIYRRVIELLPDDQYRLFQTIFLDRPDMGAIIPGIGGLRKVRWNASGRGKRAGVRIIYYWVTKQEKILLLYIYAKNETSDLSAEQIKKLKQLVEKDLS